MPRYLIDYSIAVPYLGGVRPIVDNVNAHLADVYLTPGVVEELYCGVRNAVVGKKQLDAFAWNIQHLKLDKQVAAKFAEFKMTYSKHLLECDIRLAAYAAGYKAIIVTSRVLDFKRIPVIRAIDWSI